MKFNIYKEHGHWFLEFDKTDFLILIEKAVKKHIKTMINSFIEKNTFNFYYAEIALILLIISNIELYYLIVLTT